MPRPVQASPANAPADPPASRMVASATRGVLGLLDRPEVDLALWQRPGPDPSLAAWLDALPPAQLPAGRVVLAPALARETLSALCDIAGMAEGPGRGWLVDDMTAMIALFAECTGSSQVDMRVERVDGDACWKFHRDQVRRRLLTTYRGPGTEWVLPAHADDALARQRDYDGPLHRIDRFAVALFKGCASTDGAGVLHRSPPVAGTGITRLVLCINLPPCRG